MGSKKTIIGALTGGPIGAAIGAAADHKDRKEEKAKRTASSSTLAKGKTEAEAADEKGVNEYDATSAQRKSVNALRKYREGTDTTGNVKRTLGA